MVDMPMRGSNFDSVMWISMYIDMCPATWLALQGWRCVEQAARVGCVAETAAVAGPCAHDYTNVVPMHICQLYVIMPEPGAWLSYRETSCEFVTDKGLGAGLQGWCCVGQATWCGCGEEALAATQQGPGCQGPSQWPHSVAHRIKCRACKANAAGNLCVNLEYHNTENLSRYSGTTQPMLSSYSGTQHQMWGVQDPCCR